MRRLRCTVISKTVGNQIRGSLATLAAGGLLARHWGVPEEMEPRGGIKAWPSQWVFGSITLLPGLLAFIVFAFSDLAKKGNTFRAVPSNRLLERTYHCPWDAVLTTNMGTLALVMTWEAACPLTLVWLWKSPVWVWKARPGCWHWIRWSGHCLQMWCLLYPTLSAYYPASWIIQPSLCWTVLPASGVPAGLYVEQELWFVLSPECWQTLFKRPDTAGKVPRTPNVTTRVRGLGFSGHCCKWDGVAEGRQMPPIAPPSSLSEALCSYTVLTLTTATRKERPAVKTQLNARLYAVESGSLSRMLFLFLNTNGFANQLILVYNWLTQHFFLFFLSFFPPSLLYFFFLLFSLSFPLQRNIFTSVAFTPELYIKITQWR